MHFHFDFGKFYHFYLHVSLNFILFKIRKYEITKIVQLMDKTMIFAIELNWCATTSNYCIILIKMED